MRLVIFCLALLGISSTVIAQSNLWQQFHDSFTTLEAQFQQITDDEISIGKLSIDKNMGSLRIDILSPYAQTITLYDNKVTLYNIPVKSANIVAYEPNVFIELLLGNQLIPLRQTTEHQFTYDTMQIDFDPETEVPIRITRLEDGKFITVEFLAIQRDPSLNPRLFALELPEYVDIIDETY